MIHYASAEMKLQLPDGFLDEVIQTKKDLVTVSQCRHGTFMYFPHDFYLGGAMDRYGEYAEDESRLLMKFIRPGDIVVEVGANAGFHTVALAKQVGPSGRVMAFEPQRIIYQMMCGNIALNELWNVFTAQMALGASNGWVSVPPVDYSQEGNFGAVEMCNEGERVQIVTLDSMQLSRCDLIKIDVEGMEQQVLQGGYETIKRSRPVLYVENDREGKQEDLLNYIQSLEYDCYAHLPKLFSKFNYRGNQDNEYGETISLNMLCLPRERQFDIPETVEAL